MRNRGGKLDPGRTGADQDESHLARTLLLVIGRFSQFKCTQDLCSDRLSVVEALEAWRELRELVMTEIAWMHSSSNHQEVVFEFSTANPRASNFDTSSSKTDALDLGQQHAEVLLFR